MAPGRDGTDDRNEETALGGADAVEKTSYVTGSGAEPEGKPIAGAATNVPRAGGVSVGAILIGVVALAIALVYAAGLFR